MVLKSRSNPALRRLGVSVLALVIAASGVAFSGGLSATGRSFPAPTPPASCGKGDLPETGVQGRVPSSDYDSGRAAQGYRCNTRGIGHQGRTGGFKVLRYRDRSGHTCAFYDSTRFFPTDVPFQVQNGFGVVVLDMANPKQPKVTATLTSPTMLSPHESLLVNQRRGLLAAVKGNAYTSAGILEVYDVRSDCRSPQLLSRTPEAVLGHESGWTLDGRTFYAASSGGQTLVAIDLTDPTAPEQLFFQRGVNYHGMRLSPDGRTLYAANIGNDLSGGTLPGEGLRILDVSQIQDRVADPEVSVVSNLTWPEGSIPQVAQPFTRRGHDYLLEVDEFSRYGLNGGSPDASQAVVGAGRIIDVADPAHPKVVSNLRLEVQQPAERVAASGDPGASSPVGGYTAHYCSAPYRKNPRIVACSMIGSGLRVFDISNLRKPVEVAYYNQPSTSGSQGASAMSQPAWDVKRRSIWFADGNSGFHVVKLTHGVGRLLRR